MTTQPQLLGLTALTQVADVGRSLEFYKKLGFTVRSTFPEQGDSTWAWLEAGAASLMVAALVLRLPERVDQAAIELAFRSPRLEHSCCCCNGVAGPDRREPAQLIHTW